MHSTLSLREGGADQARPYAAIFVRAIGRFADSIARWCWIFDYWMAERRHWGAR